MGKNYSKQKNEQDDVEESKLYDRKKIYIDEFGNFCLGEVQFDPEEEMMRIMACDDTTDEDGKEWCIINTPWMKAWMLYCHLNRDINPNPGPCRNECLLVADEEGEALIAKPGLVMATKDMEGDYRRISKAAWDVFCELYPGSGPEIKVKFYEDEEHKQDGVWDTSVWEIDQSNFQRSDQPKKKLFGGFGLSGKKTDVAVVDLPDSKPTDIAMVEMEDGAISEEKREKVSEFFGRRTENRPVSHGGAADAKYHATPSDGEEKLLTQESEDMNKWLFEE